MKIENKYVISGVRRSVGLNLKTVVFFIPFIILILSFVFSIILPTYNHYQFVKNGNHSYVYNLNDNDYKKLGQPVEMIYYDRNITSKPNPELDQSDYNIFYKYTKLSSAYICKEDIDLDKTMFTKKNILKSKKYDGPNIWLSFELANSLHVGMGDEVYIRFTTMTDDFEDVPFKVSGIIRSKYADDNPTKTNSTMGNAVLFLDDEEFRKVLNDTMQGGKSKAFFTDEKLDGMDQFLTISRDAQLEVVNEFIDMNIIKAIYVIICGIVLIYIVLSFDMNFTLKRHNKNMIILNMLGTPINVIRRIFVKLTILNFTISLVTALILVKFFFMQRLLSIYVGFLPLLVSFIICMLVAVVSATIQSFRIKKL